MSGDVGIFKRFKARSGGWGATTTTTKRNKFYKVGMNDGSRQLGKFNT